MLAQSFRNFELIVVDDGSTDETPRVLGLYGNRLSAIRQWNEGASSARNTGIRHAKGKWIAFLDSDDIWHPDKLKIQAEELQSNPAVVAHMVDGATADPAEQSPSRFDLSGMTEEFTKQPIRDRPLDDVLNSSFLTTCWLVRRKAIEKAGYFDPSLRFLEDFDLLTRIALEGPFMVNCHIGAIKRQRPGGAPPLSHLCHTEKLEFHQGWVKILTRLKMDQRLTTAERRLVCRWLSSQRSELAVQFARKRWWHASIAAHIASVVDDPGLLSVARSLLAASGTIELARKFFQSYVTISCWISGRSCSTLSSDPPTTTRPC